MAELERDRKRLSERAASKKCLLVDAIVRARRIHKGRESHRNDVTASKSIEQGHTGQQVTE